MKLLKGLLLLLFLNGVGEYGNAQTTLELTDTTNKWYEFGLYYAGDYYQRSHLVYYFEGDTNLYNKDFRKLYSRNKDTIFYSASYTPIENTLYRGCFRQEGQQVYFILPNQEVPRLYCDFDMQEGDTVKYYYNQLGAKVLEVNSVMFGTHVIREYRLDNDFIFFEGIGNGLGLFHDFSSGIEGGQYLVCFENQGLDQDVYQLFGDVPTCIADQVLAVEKGSEAEGKGTLFPNPVREQLFFTGPVQGNLRCKVFTGMGLPVNVDASWLHTNYLEVGELPPGIYFIQVWSGKSILLWERFVKE